jgi:hypothetical protein
LPIIISLMILRVFMRRWGAATPRASD